MTGNKLYHIYLCFLWVSGIFVFQNIHPLYSQSDSSAYYLAQVEKYTDLFLENRISHDSCIEIYKQYHSYQLSQHKSSQGIKDVRSQVGKIMKASAYSFAAQLVDSMGSWVELKWLNDKSVDDFGYLYIYNGFACMQSRNNLSAINAYEEALKIYQHRFDQLCNTENLGRCLLRENRKADYDKLWRFIYHPLVKLYNKIGDVDLVKLYLPNDDEILLIRKNQMLNQYHVTNIYMELIGNALATKDTMKAYELSQKSYRLHQEYTDKKFKALLNLAHIERTLNKFDDAHSHLNQVIKYAETQIESDKISIRLWRDGHLFKGYAYRDEALSLVKTKPEKAKELFEKANSEYDLLIDLISENADDIPSDNVNLQKELIHLLHSRGDIGYYTQNFKEAETYYQKALSMVWKERGPTDHLPSIESLDLDWDLFYSLEGLGKIWYQQHALDQHSTSLQKASNAYELVFAMEDSFRVRYPTQGSRQTQQRNSQKRLKARMRIAQDLWEENKDEQSIHLALNIMDRSRALEMQAHLQGSTLEKDLNKNQKKLIDTISTIQEKLYQLHLETPEIDNEQNHIRLIENTNETLIAYRNKLKKQNPTYYRMKFTPQTSSLKKIQKKLKNNEALVNYYWDQKSLYRLVIGHEFYDLEKQPITEELNENIRDVVAFTKNQRPAKKEQLTYQKAALSLYQQLLGGLEGQHFEELIIVPDGPLSKLAFEVLLTEETDSTKALDYRQLNYVLQKYLIRYQFVPHFLLDEEELRPSDKDTPILYAGFAPTYNFDYVSSLGRSQVGNLEFNIYEVDAAFQLFSAFSSNNEQFIDSIARETKFREIAPQAEILHVAMHALTDEDGFENSYIQDPYLLFSNQKNISEHDDRLFMQEIYDLGLKADLMVLSACNTGMGKLAVSEGMLSLGRAFRMAGCNNIISSLWNVNDESSQMIIQTFFTSLLEGKGKAEALRAAKEAYLFNPLINNRKAAPYYWAQFVLLGDNTQLSNMESPEKPAYFIWIGILTLMVVVGFIVRYHIFNIGKLHR